MPDDPHTGAQRGLPSLAGVRFNWNRMAELDPTAYIARQPGSAVTTWEREAFLAGGDAIVESCARRAADLGAEFRGARALDFGCGVGRMARALVERYEAYVGVDIAEQMLARTPEFVDSPRARFVHSPRGDLAVLGEQRFDLVWSYVTLQHVPPESAATLLGALASRVAAGGWLCVQLPVRSCSDRERIYGRATWKGRLRALLPRDWLERWRARRNRGPRCDMFGVPPAVVTATLSGAGLEVLAADVVDDTLGLVESRRYFARRPPATTSR